MGERTTLSKENNTNTPMTVRRMLIQTVLLPGLPIGPPCSNQNLLRRTEAF
jgi:hypothetical protein